MNFIFDFATIAAIVVVFILFVFVIATVRASERRVEKKLRQIAQHTHLLADNDQARELCRVIQREYPDACPGLDFTLREDAEGIHLDAWYSKRPRPTKATMSKAEGSKSH